MYENRKSGMFSTGDILIITARYANCKAQNRNRSSKWNL